MDLILWRHAEAAEGGNDLARELTPKGEKQAARVAQWLLQRLPARFALISSPAARAQQTAQALGIPVKTAKDLGQAAAFLIAGSPGRVSIKKGGLWWLSDRVRGEEAQVVVRAVVSPDLL